MQQLRKACEDAQHYPLNLVYPNTYHHNLCDYFKRLGDREKDLFRENESSLVDLLELDHEKGERTLSPLCCRVIWNRTLEVIDLNVGSYDTTVTTLSDLGKHLWKYVEMGGSLPSCRFML